MDMGTQGAGRKRLPNRERLTAEDDALNQIAREAEARLAAKRAARAEAREIRMKELERQQKETNGYDGDLYGSQSLSRRSGRSSSYSGDGRSSTLSASREEKLPSCLYSAAGPSSGSYRSHFTLESLSKRQAPAWDSGLGRARRGSACGTQAPSEHSGHLSSSSRASSRASSARASPVVEERPEKDFTEKGSRNPPSLSAATLASLGGTSTRRGSGDTSVSVDTEASMREIKELHELQDQIQDVEGKYMQGLKEMKDSLAEVEEKYKKAMVSNAQLDNEKTNYMYQVDTLKDTLLGLEEQLAESRRQYEEKSQEFEREKHAHGLLRFQLAEMKAALQQREELLQEIQQLQQKQASYVREISDLQETIEWKDKKIGALERQKEFFDSIRSERDDLREEVGVLKEELKKHGIILNSEVAANGETSDTLTSTRHQGPTRTTREEPPALQATGDGPLGKATEVEVRNETVDGVGHREILQGTEREQRQEDPVEDGADTEVLPPGGSAKDQRPSDNSALSLATVADATNEDQVQSQVLANMSVLEHTEQGGSSEVTSTPDAGARASECLRELDGDLLGPKAEQGGGGVLDPLNQSRESAETQEREKQDCGTSLGEVRPEPHQESAPLQIPKVDQVRGSQSSVQAGPTGSGGPEGTVASRPPRGGVDTVSQDDRCEADVPREVGARAGRGLETEPTNQEAGDPGAAPAQSTAQGVCGDEEETEGTGFENEKPTQTEVQTSPSFAVATHHEQEASGPHTADAKSKLLDAKEPGEDSNDLQGEGLDSPQKKTKNRKKRNKKKKSPAPAETSADAREELRPQSPGLSEVKEEEQARFADEKPGTRTPDEAPGSPKRNSVSGSSENRDLPESADMEVDGKLNPGDGDADAETGRAIADGEPALPEGDAVQASGSLAGAGGSEGGGGTNGEDAAPCRPPGDEGVPPGALLGGQSPSRDVHGESQGIREASGGLSPESDGVAPRESGDYCSDSREEAGGQSEKDKSKEDCALS
ncbi:leucine-rich repeat flightless-interacting protein 1 isoform X3 [Sturnira hondurensis]|uniref:leucine-rich repeat flightless-interacting protein 1 isoform X3 n=1 Tax=Sturnira hondurensis TaxID=192404 RepID=UPI00187963DC|nr:leucine-rich repeat flightless-interacting protein 1 isoform X3 [Sturnira hondurensis]